MNQNPTNLPQEEHSSVSLRQLHHDLRSALGTATITVETLLTLEASEEGLAGDKRVRMLERALSSLTEAAQVTDALQSRSRESRDDG